MNFSMEQSLTTIPRERWRTYAWEGSPPPPFRNIQYIAAALALLYVNQEIDSTDPEAAIHLLKAGLPSASAEDITFTFRVLQDAVDGAGSDHG